MSINSISGFIFQPQQASVDIPKEVQEHLNSTQHVINTVSVGDGALFQKLEAERLYFKQALQKTDLSEEVKLIIKNKLADIHYHEGCAVAYINRLTDYYDDETGIYYEGVGQDAIFKATGHYWLPLDSFN